MPAETVSISIGVGAAPDLERSHATSRDHLTPSYGRSCWVELERRVMLLRKGQLIESTHKVPTSHYHTKSGKDWRCHHGRATRWT